MIGKYVCFSNRESEAPSADQNNVVLPSRPQDGADLTDQGIDVVTNATLSEGAKAR